MKTSPSFLWIACITIISLVGKCESTCYCERVYTESSKGYYSYYRFGCSDVESADECKKANWEVTDMISSLASLVDNILDNHLEATTFSVLQVGFIRSLLSYAIEHEKPEGDCADGLVTKTRISGTKDLCYSPVLLEQCEIVRTSVDPYQENIPILFREAFYSTTDMYNTGAEVSWLDRSKALGLVTTTDDVFVQELEELVEVIRFRTSLTTANIRCASYDSTQDDLNGGGKMFNPMYNVSLLMTVMVSTVLSLL